MAGQRGQLRGWRWWAAAIGVAVAFSAVLHVIAAGLIFLTPLKDVIFPDEAPVRRTYSPEQIQETADDIRRDTARRLRDRLAEVQEILATLTDIRNQKVKDYPKARGGSLATTREAEALDARLADMEGLFGIYQAARLLENGCYDVYEGWRAVTLAAQQKLTLDRAREATRLVRPTRREARQDLLEGPVRSLAEFRRFRDEIIFAKGQIDAIVIAAKRMRDVVIDIDAPELGSGQTIAIENSGTLYQGGSGEMEWGATVGPPLLADEIFPSKASRLTQMNFLPRPGRKIGADGVPMKWMYVESWYTIGPFPNPGRQNLDKKFPPESVVDLNMTYVGKYDRVVRWRHMRAPSLCVNPYDVDKYAIYYAWTEIWSQEDRDYWIAFGSDDYGKVWVNGKLIWASGEQPHAWIPDRGFRKVRLKRGPNQVLFKIENAGGTMGFSLVLAVAPAAG